MSYTIETVLAEKLETVVSRGLANTRPRDFYDIHVLWKLRGSECDGETLAQALMATSVKRGSVARMSQWRPVLDEVASDHAMEELWAKYVKKNPYASGMSLSQCCEAAKGILSSIG